MTTVIHHRLRQPIDEASGDYVYIGRPSKWGNPYRIGSDGTRAEVIAKYETWLRGCPDLLADLPELKDKTLGCWCKPLPCHGDVLARLADAT